MAAEQETAKTGRMQNKANSSRTQPMLTSAQGEGYERNMQMALLQKQTQFALRGVWHVRAYRASSHDAFRRAGTLALRRNALRRHYKREPGVQNKANFYNRQTNVKSLRRKELRGMWPPEWSWKTKPISRR